MAAERSFSACRGRPSTHAQRSVGFSAAIQGANSTPSGLRGDGRARVVTEGRSGHHDATPDGVGGQPPGRRSMTATEAGSSRVEQPAAYARYQPTLDIT